MAALTGVVAVVLAQTRPPESVPRSIDVCAALQMASVTVFYERVIPPEATPEFIEAFQSLNAQLAQTRAQIKETCQ